MRISEIGKAKAGYTLLEVMGVILLIGLTLTLVQPEIFHAAEKNQVHYAGKLLQADLERIQAEVKAGNAVVVKFNAGGYCFALGETEIIRDYRAKGLIFKAEGPGVSLAPRPPASDGATTDQTENGGATAELQFISDHDGPLATIIWRNKNYQGAVMFQADGAASWRYHVK